MKISTNILYACPLQCTHDGQVFFAKMLLLQSLTLAVVRWPTASENLFGPVTFANFFQ
jgi:hypothetical protein